MKLHDTIDVLIGGYMSRDAAEEDYNAVLDCGGTSMARWSSARISRATSTVEQTDHMVRKGAEGLGAVGLAVGLFAPPLLATTAVGAALGAGAGKLLHHKSGEKLAEQAGETIPLGGAGLIVVYSKADAEKVEAAVDARVSTTIGEAEGRHVQAMKGAMADAQEKAAASQE